MRILVLFALVAFVGCDTTPPQLAACPDDLQSSCDEGASSLDYSMPTATDDRDPFPMVRCTPAPGSIVGGSTQVTCVAEDASGNTDQCTFSVTISDSTPPEPICPPQITVLESALGSGEANVTFSTSATDDCDRFPDVVCDPPSGSLFKVDESPTQVSCVAEDDAGNMDQCNFSITVNPSTPQTSGCDPAACFDGLALQPAQINCFRPTNRWPMNHLTYRLTEPLPGLSASGQREALDRAFDLWAAQSMLTFERVEGAADINISFLEGNHGDTIPFDGPPNDRPQNILGHAFFPEPDLDMRGEIHLCGAENWVLENGPGDEPEFDLFTAMVHEIGHALGVEHSLDPAAVMFPSYSGPIEALATDDVDSIQKLYGSADGSIARLETPTPNDFKDPMDLTARGDPDTDMDGIPDTIEVFILGTDPLDADSDGDGVNDFVEVFADGTEPTDNNSFVREISFTAGVPISSEASCILSLASGDFTGDGRTDLVVQAQSPGFGTSQTTIFANDGNALFEPVATLADTLRTVLAADLDADGNLDLAAAGDGFVRVFFNDGNNTFSQSTIFDSGIPQGTSMDLIAADLDGDGDLDLAATSPPIGQAPAPILLFMNQGGRVFDPGASVSVGQDTAFAVDLEARDFDGDGDIDLSFIKGSLDPGPVLNVNTVSILRNKGNATFTSPEDVFTGDQDFLGFLASEDLDNDGDFDLLVSSSSSDANAVLVLVNDGNASFSQIQMLKVDNPVAATTADLDRNGSVDVIVNDAEGAVVVFRNAGGIAFGKPLTFPVGAPVQCASFRSLLVDDLDGDGDFDIARHLDLDSVTLLLNDLLP